MALKMDKQGFVRHAAVYGLANLLLQAGGVVLIPLYTHFLTLADYGVLEVLGRLAETVGTILLFGGVRQALLTFYQQSSNEVERRQIVSTTLSLFAVTCLVGGVPVLTFAEPISRWLSAALEQGGTAVTPGLLRLAVLGIILEPWTLLPLALVQARVESTTFVLITLSQFVVRVSLCVLLVAWLNLGVAGVLAATALTGAMYGIGMSARELARGRARPHAVQMRALLRFALPFVPGGLCFFLLHHGDRFFLLRWCGREEVGLYALGYKLALAVSMFSLTPLYMVWSTHMYAAARLPDAAKTFGRAFTRILAVFLVVGLALCLLQDELVAFIAHSKPAFAGATRVIPPVVLACFFQAAASLMDAAFYVCHRTGMKLGITLSATVLTVVLYYLLIPAYGSMGAALATLGGFAFLAVCTWWVTQQIFPVRYEWPRLAALLALTCGLWWISRCLPVGGWAVAVKLGLLLAWPLVVWWGGLISRDEKEHTRDLVKHATWRLAPAVLRIPRRRSGDACGNANGLSQTPVLLAPTEEGVLVREPIVAGNDRPVA
jgi:O-antigen/teichoic acid export membrane protein